MELYKIDQEDMSRIPERDVRKEKRLEGRLVQTKAAKIGGIEILYIGRQGTTEHGKHYDIVGVDEKGDLIVVELKRDTTPRNVVAQALDYTSRLRHQGYSDLQDEYEQFLSEHNYVEEDIPALSDSHQKYFNLDEPLSEEEFNNDQRILIIGSTIDDATTNMADYLRDRGGIDVVLVEYNLYRDGEDEIELLTTNAIRRPLEEEPAAQSRKSLSEKEQRRKEFWREFQSAYQEYNLAGGGINRSASYHIFVFESGNKRRPVYVRPKAGYSNVANQVRFYQGAREVVEKEELRREFEAAFRQACDRLTTESGISPEAAEMLSWDLDETRDFDVVTISYTDAVPGDFTDEETLQEIKTWLLDTSRIYKETLIEMEKKGYISVS